MCRKKNKYLERKIIRQPIYCIILLIETSTHKGILCTWICASNNQMSYVYIIACILYSWIIGLPQLILRNISSEDIGIYISKFKYLLTESYLNKVIWGIYGLRCLETIDMLKLNRSEGMVYKSWLHLSHWFHNSLHFIVQSAVRIYDWPLRRARTIKR